MSTVIANPPSQAEGDNLRSSSSCACAPVSTSSCCGGEKSERSVGDLTWFRVALALAIAGQGMVFGLGYNNAHLAGEAPPFGSPVYWILHGALLASALVVIALLGGPLVTSTIRSLRNRQVTVEALFLLTASGAFAASIVSTLRGEGSVYYEVVGVVLVIYTVGRKIGARTRSQALAAANHWRDLFQWVHLESTEGNRRRVAVADLTEDSVVVVLPGEAIPVDGIILEGVGSVQETIMTGELIPTTKRPGQTVYAGSYSVDCRFRIEPRRDTPMRTLDRILETVESAAARPSRFQTQADRLISWFLPVVISISTATFFVWWILLERPWVEALFNAMAVLLVACPCALGLAMPIAIWTGLLTLSRRGLVSRDGQLLDGLARAEEWFFDKTGTLSSGEPTVQSFTVVDETLGESWLRSAVATLEAGNAHPLAQSLETLSVDRLPLESVRILPGQGIEGIVDGRRLQVGSVEWLEQKPLGAAGREREVAVSVEGRLAARVTLVEVIDEGAAGALRSLREMGARLHIISGDPAPSHDEIGGVPVEGGVGPDRKLSLVREATARTPGVVFVGDGMNDAAAIAAAPVGLAINGGAGLATASAAGILMGDNLAVLPWAVRFCRNLQARLRGNMLFALVYNFIGISLAAAGMLHPVVAALLMLGSSAIVSWRAAQVGEWAEKSLESHHLPPVAEFKDPDPVY